MSTANASDTRYQWVDEFTVMLNHVPDDRLEDLAPFLELELQQLGVLADLLRSARAGEL